MTEPWVRALERLAAIDAKLDDQCDRLERVENSVANLPAMGAEVRRNKADVQALFKAAAKTNAQVAKIAGGIAALGVLIQQLIQYLGG